ncbi:olfactory receptor 5B12-like [Gastrophryne carolinensis]
MDNQTALTNLFFSGLSDLPSLQLPLFLFFFLIYLLTLTWNLLIISLIVTDSHLHTPMYFFLGNLASLDLCFSSVTVPRMLLDLQTQKRMVTRMTCLTQVFFFILFLTSEIFLLAIMSCDRYVAICRPLHYMQIMHWRVCVHCVVVVWSLSVFLSALHTLFALNLTFCRSNIIESFFCDLPQLFQITCSDIFINILLTFLSAFTLGILCFMVTFLPYVYILKTVFKMKNKGKRSKVLSTCSSHVTVVFIFYGTLFFNYFHGNNIYVLIDRVASVFYTALTPLLNPLIYSLRNQDFRAAFRDVKQHSWNGDRGVTEVQAGQVPQEEIHGGVEVRVGDYEGDNQQIPGEGQKVDEKKDEEERQLKTREVRQAREEELRIMLDLPLDRNVEDGLHQILLHGPVIQEVQDHKTFHNETHCRRYSMNDV